MNGLLKQILAIALLVAALPCCHALAHELHASEPVAAAELHAGHSCSCHSCEPASCGDETAMPQNRSAAPPAIALPSSFVQPFVLVEAKPARKRAPLLVVGVLASLQTVRLLI
jgi:hypothetical protein